MDAQSVRREREEAGSPDVSAWYKTARWERRRELQLSLQPLCARCPTPTWATVADHVVPHRGDAWLFWFGELQSLCAPCHSSGKQKEELAGYSATPDQDGWPLDPHHPANHRGGVG